jgi:hypothetical protein
VVYAFVATVAGTVLLVLCFFRWPARAGNWVQPDEIDYGSFGPYSLTVWEVSPLLAPWPRYEVWVTRRGDPYYGHATGYEFHNSTGDEDYFDRCVVDWTPDGVAITEPSGHRLFIPKSAFVGGR